MSPGRRTWVAHAVLVLGLICMAPSIWAGEITLVKGPHAGLSPQAQKLVCSGDLALELRSLIDFTHPGYHWMDLIQQPAPASPIVVLTVENPSTDLTFDGRDWDYTRLVSPQGPLAQELFTALMESAEAGNPGVRVERFPTHVIASGNLVRCWKVLGLKLDLKHDLYKCYLRNTR